MKKYLLCLFLCLIACSASVPPPAKEPSPVIEKIVLPEITWHELNPQTLEKARVENKPLIFFFHISHCKWCQLMKENTLKDPAIVKIIQKDFIFVGIDGDIHPEVLPNLVEEPAYPTTLFALPSGDVIPFPFTGYIPPMILRQVLDITTETVHGKPNAK